MLKAGLLCSIAILLVALTGSLSADDPAPDHPSADGLVLWLDASDAPSITADAQGHVLKWADRSGHSYEVSVEAPATSDPKLMPGAINGKPAIHFSGRQALLGQAVVRAAPGPVSIFIVARRSPDQANPAEIQPLFTSLRDPGAPEDQATNFNLTTTNGAGKPVDTTIFYGEAASVPIGPFALGRAPAMTPTFLNGDIAEVLIYDRPFAASEVQSVAEYLRAKWNANPPLFPGEWTREGGLDPTPAPVHNDLPLSDQDNQGKWVLDSKLSDEFKEASLDLDRWHLAPTASNDWRGRQPALFMPSNVALSHGMLELTDRKGDVPEMAKYPGQGYAGYTSALMETKERSGYGYYEIKARPMNSAFCTAFWMTDTGLEDNATEIDMFEIGAKAIGREYDDNMTAHVWATPQEKKRHWGIGSVWKAPWKLGDDFHVYGFEWNKDELRWYVDGVIVHKLKNTNWFFPMRIIFDSEPMWQWFGKVNDADLPSTYDVQYLRVWRQQTP